MATIKQVANKIGKDLNESYPNIQNLFDVLKRGFKEMEDVSGGGGGGSEVDWTQLQVTGTKIAEIEIDGDTTNVYAPASQTIAVSQIQTTGTKIASISINGDATDVYAPASQTIAVSQIQTTGTKIASISLDGVSTDIFAPNGGSGVTRTTLWSNADTTENFSAGNLNLSDALTNYDEVILYYNPTTSSQFGCFPVSINLNAATSSIFGVQNYGGSGNVYTRVFTYTNSTTIAVADCSQSATPGTPANNNIIPNKVIGIKY